MQSNIDKRNTIAVAILVIVLAGYIYYRDVGVDMQKRVDETIPRAVQELNLSGLESTVTYQAPGITHTIRFVVLVDEEGIIHKVEGTELGDPKYQPKIKEFSKDLTDTVKGVALAELGPLDKVGSSTLTTDAFNEALENIKAQL